MPEAVAPFVGVGCVVNLLGVRVQRRIGALGVVHGDAVPPPAVLERVVLHFGPLVGIVCVRRWVLHDGIAVGERLDLINGGAPWGDGVPVGARHGDVGSPVGEPGALCHRLTETIGDAADGAAGTCAENADANQCLLDRKSVV